MCGIAGFIGGGDEKDLLNMINSIQHRGPDDQGHFINNGVALAHARLSIIDLSEAGHQPMWNDDKSVAIVFNGEIYNFKKIKKEFDLINKYKFRSETDTEVILYLYEEIGEMCFEKLDGMFAIAIYDFRNNKLVLARDRTGEKPLYWGTFNKTLIFGSELQALKKHSFVKTDLNREALGQYLVREYVPTPMTIFQNIYKLEPAHYLIYQDDKITKKSFWSMPSNTTTSSFNKSLTELGSILEKSIEDRIVADVPVGIFLSGGLDSSTLTYYAQKISDKKVKTFSIGFNEKSFDESNYAKQVSNFLSTDHYHKNITAQESINTLDKALISMGEPLADPTIIPNLLLSEFARSEIVVALGGDGADEILAGYPTFQAEKIIFIYKLIPAFLREYIIEPIIKSLPTSDGDFNLPFKLKKFIEGVNYPPIERHQRWLQAFSKEDLSNLLTIDFYKDISNINPYFICIESQNNSKQGLLNSYVYSYLMDGVLSKTDKASMHYGLEVRAPFLGQEILEFITELPYKYKINGFKTKYILKELMKDKLPKNIVYRKKKGFSIPVSEWLKKDFSPLLQKTFSREKIMEQGIFNVDYVENLINEHNLGKKDHRKKIWTLLIFQLWYDRFF